MDAVYRVRHVGFCTRLEVTRVGRLYIINQTQMVVRRMAQY